MMGRSRAGIRLAVLTVAGLGMMASGAMAEAPTLKLIDAGKGAKTELRFKPTKGKKETMAMTMKMHMGIDLGAAGKQDMAMPTIEMKADVVAQDVKPNGDYTYATTFSGVDVGKDGNAMIAGALKQAMSGIVGLELVATSDPMGRVQDTKMNAKAANPQLKQMLDSMTKTMDQMQILLPKEAVGLGAAWEVHQLIEENGLKIKQVTKMKVTKIAGTVITTSFELSQTAVSKEMKLPNMPPGSKAVLNKFIGGGSGVTVLDLTRLTPVSASAKMKVDMDADMEMGGQKQSMKMLTTIDMKIAGS